MLKRIRSLLCFLNSKNLPYILYILDFHGAQTRQELCTNWPPICCYGLLVLLQLWFSWDSIFGSPSNLGAANLGASFKKMHTTKIIELYITWLRFGGASKMASTYSFVEVRWTWTFLYSFQTRFSLFFFYKCSQLDSSFYTDTSNHSTTTAAAALQKFSAIIST